MDPAAKTLPFINATKTSLINRRRFTTGSPTAASSAVIHMYCYFIAIFIYGDTGHSLVTR